MGNNIYFFKVFREMKFAFASALIAAVALAQDPVADAAVDPMPKPDDEICVYEDENGVIQFCEPKSDFFEMNEEGEMVVNFPEIPGIEFTETKKDDVLRWVDSIMEQEKEIDMASEENFSILMDAIAVPFNAFLDKQNCIKNEDILTDAENT